MPAAPHHDAVDAEARSQIKGLRSEFHDFRTEIKQDVGNVREDVAAGFNKVFSRLDADTRASVQSTRSNVGQLAGFAVAVIGLTFSFTTLVTQPLRDQDARHTTIIDRQTQHEFDVSEKRAELVDRLSKLEVHAQANRADIEQMEKILEKAVDSNTRTHNEFYHLKGRLEAIPYQP